MPAARSGQDCRVGAALLVAIEDSMSPALTTLLGARSLGVQRVAAVADVPAILHYASIELVIARADAGAFAGLCESCAEVPVIAVLAGTNEQHAAEALRAGAVAVFGDTPTEDEIKLALDRALGGSDAPPSSDDLPPPAPNPGGLLGESEPMRRVAELVARTAMVPATVLVRGETGTGKELVARALHTQSPRRDGPFIKVHCAALPDALLESELFGYEKGAFTGATSRKPGRVELAEGGTLFLDEIGDITAATQVKLLRLLQDREYERLGGVQSLRADVRFVTATHRDLESMVKKGEFREDLFYRLNVVTLWLPPLRARRDDISLLATEFARQFATTYGKTAVLDEGALKALRSERWPGNVRQLQNFIERLVVLATAPSVTADDVRSEMTAQVQFKTQITRGAAEPARPVPDSPGTQPSPVSRAMSLDEAVRGAERQALERALRHASGNRTVAARILGVSRATLYTKMDELGIA
jgi:two-component system response regulator AtoC